MSVLNALSQTAQVGGSGILVLKDVRNMYKAERNIYLGRDIPNYPVAP